MVHRDDARYIPCRLQERGVPVEVAFAAAGNEAAAPVGSI